MSELTPDLKPPPDNLKPLLDCLGRLENEFERREQFWRENQDDAHGISTALMVAMAENKSAIRAVINDIVWPSPVT